MQEITNGNWQLKNWDVISQRDDLELKICTVETLSLQAAGNAKLIVTAPKLLNALRYYRAGIDHFYKCINFGKSFLDAKAIFFMNDSNVKIIQALKELD